MNLGCAGAEKQFAQDGLGLPSAGPAILQNTHTGHDIQLLFPKESRPNAPLGFMSVGATKDLDH